MGRLNNSVVKNDDGVLQEKGYHIQAVLGEGSYSKVKAAIWKKPGTTESIPVALKIINKTTAPQDFLEKFWPRERDVMGILDHDNIIKMYEVFSNEHKIYMSIERACHGDLLEFIKLKGPLCEFDTHRLFAEMCAGVKYLHSLSVIHRDLKCENILLTNENSVKIADFGFARKLEAPDRSRTFCGSAAYAAPEILRGIPYQGPVADVWSLGVILFIMGCCVMPFRDSSIRRLIHDQKASLQFPKENDLRPLYRKLVGRILCYDLSKRYTLTNILNDEWMASPPKSLLKTSISATDSGIGSDRSSSSTLSEQPGKSHTTTNT